MDNLITSLSHFAVMRIPIISFALIFHTLISLITFSEADAINLYPEATETLGKTLNPNQDIPKNKFKAFYFNTKNPNKVVSSEITELVSVNYAWSNFNSISSSNFGGYWVGEFDFKESTTKTFITYLSHAKVRVIIDNHVIYKGGGRKVFNYTFAKGTHKIEVEFYNNWHTTKFFLGIRDLQRTYSSNNIKSAFDSDKIKQARVYIENKRGSSERSLYRNIRVEKTNQPVVLYLPDDYINYIIENNDSINLVGVIHSEKSVVHFNGKPTKVFALETPREFLKIISKIQTSAFGKYASRFYNIGAQKIFGLPFGGLPDESSGSSDVYFVHYPINQRFSSETEADFVRDAVLSGNEVLLDFAVTFSQLNKGANAEVVSMLKSLENFNDQERTSLMSKFINRTGYYGDYQEYNRFHEQLKVIEEKELRTLPPLALGEKLFNKSCNQCHTTDGKRLLGPTFKGIYNSIRYLADNTKVNADEEYLIESIIKPAKKIVKNYPAICYGHVDNNGKINEKEVEALVQYIKTL